MQVLGKSDCVDVVVNDLLVSTAHKFSELSTLACKCVSSRNISSSFPLVVLWSENHCINYSQNRTISDH